MGIVVVLSNSIPMHQEILTGVLTLEVVFDVYNRLLQATKTIQTFHWFLKYISDKKIGSIMFVIVFVENHHILLGVLF